jgi:serine/threonine protein kinase
MVPKDEGCPFIAKYYSPLERRGYRPDLLLMEYYYYSSLDQFRIKQDYTSSLTSKLYLIYQICLGMKYYIEKRVTHNDLKP